MHNPTDRNILILIRMVDGTCSESNVLGLIIFQYQALKRQCIVSAIIFTEKQLYMSILSQ
jgi:hypothetical protein